MNKTKRTYAILMFILIMILLPIFISCGSGKKGNSITSVNGVVLDESGNSIKDAVVTIYSNPVTVHTDISGYFSAEVEAGDHTIKIEKDYELIYTSTFSCDDKEDYSFGNIKTSYNSEETSGIESDDNNVNKDDTGLGPTWPLNVMAVSGDGEATISWDPVENAKSYNIYISTINGFDQEFKEEYLELRNTVSTSYLCTGLINMTAYYFRVTAVNSYGESGSSTQVNAFPRSSESIVQGQLYPYINPDINPASSFGTSVGIDGDYAIVSANGSAYIYHMTGPNTWDKGIKIQPPNTEYTVFGENVAISGDSAIISDRYDNTAAKQAGAAYIYTRTGTNTWEFSAKLFVPGVKEGYRLGNSVAISGDYAIVGCRYDDEGGLGAGAAYIFHRTGTNTWDAGTKIMAYDASTIDFFGESVAIDGDYAIVGAFWEGGDDYTGPGAAYIFRRTGENTWDKGTKIKAQNSSNGALFGASVDIKGDYVIAGAYGEPWYLNGGNAYIFHRTGPNLWDQGVKIQPPVHGGEMDSFGYAVAINGNYAVVGAHHAVVELNADYSSRKSGAAYIYGRTDTNSWDSGKEIVAPNLSGFTEFGYSVNMNDNYTIVGAANKETAYVIPLH